MKSPLVSVIIPVFNRRDLLLEAVACVEAQSYRPLEVILVDDGSSDGTGELCDRIAEERPDLVRAVHQPNGGPGLAREAGRRVAEGDYIQYLDSDDWLHPRKIECQVAALENDPGAGVCYCMTTERRVAAGDSGTPLVRTTRRFDTIFPAFLSGRLWHTVTPLWRREATDRIGPWTGLRVEEDLEYDARAGGLGVRPVWCPEWLVEHRHHPGPRASGNSLRNVSKMRDRATSHGRVYRHALAAGVGPEHPEMQWYARELFFLSRQCGATGLADESRMLFDLAREAAGPEKARGLDFLAYGAAAASFGWSRIGALTCWGDRLRLVAGGDRDD